MSGGTRRSMIAACVLLAALTGCQRQLAGTWQLVEAKPSREVFALDDAQFTKAGRYDLRITIEGHTRQESGDFQFNGFDLTLRPDVGGRRVYNARLSGHTLTVTDAGRRVTLQRSRR